jgi:hypothetical protein
MTITDTIDRIMYEFYDRSTLTIILNASMKKRKIQVSARVMKPPFVPLSLFTSA